MRYFLTVALSFIAPVALAGQKEADSCLNAFLKPGTAAFTLHISRVAADTKRYYATANTAKTEYQLSCQRGINSCFRPRTGVDYEVTLETDWIYFVDAQRKCLLGSLRIDAERERAK